MASEKETGQNACSRSIHPVSHHRSNKMWLNKIMEMFVWYLWGLNMTSFTFYERQYSAITAQKNGIWLMYSSALCVVKYFPISTSLYISGYMGLPPKALCKGITWCSTTKHLLHNSPERNLKNSWENIGGSIRLISFSFSMMAQPRYYQENNRVIGKKKKKKIQQSYTLTVSCECSSHWGGRLSGSVLSW